MPRRVPSPFAPLLSQAAAPCAGDLHAIHLCMPRGHFSGEPLCSSFSALAFLLVAMDGVFASSVCDAGVAAKVLERLQLAESTLRSGGSALAMEVSEAASSALAWAAEP